VFHGTVERAFRPAFSFLDDFAAEIAIAAAGFNIFCEARV
jgi:hypothetical protein